MGDLRLKRVAMADGKIDRALVEIDRLPDRSVDRATLVKWMRDGHSVIPVVSGRRLPALLLVEVGDAFAIRDTPDPVDEDRLPALPGL